MLLKNIFKNATQTPAKKSGVRPFIGYKKCGPSNTDDPNKDERPVKRQLLYSYISFSLYPVPGKRFVRQTSIECLMWQVTSLRDLQSDTKCPAAAFHRTALKAPSVSGVKHIRAVGVWIGFSTRKHDASKTRERRIAHTGCSGRGVERRKKREEGDRLVTVAAQHTPYTTNNSFQFAHQTRLESGVAGRCLASLLYIWAVVWEMRKLH